MTAPSPSIDPWSLLRSPRDTAPTIALGTCPGSNPAGLVFSVAHAQGAPVFTEVPLAMDACPLPPLSEHSARHNCRHAWSITEECIKALTPTAIESLLRANYATGIIGTQGSRWDSPGDDSALQYMAHTYDMDASSVRHLYDVVATNCLLAGLVMATIGKNTYHPAPRYGFFLLLSRANHSCVPSAMLTHSSSRDGVVTVSATRSVKPGDALTIDYLPNIALAKKRFTLFEAYGFRCACHRCSRLCSWLDCNERGTKTCSKCRRAAYCSVEHQRLDWKRHKTDECCNE